MSIIEIGECGAVVFEIYGSLDSNIDLRTRKHIFVKDKVNYYAIPDDVPQFETY